MDDGVRAPSKKRKKQSVMDDIHSSLPQPARPVAGIDPTRIRVILLLYNVIINSVPSFSLPLPLSLLLSPLHLFPILPLPLFASRL